MFITIGMAIGMILVLILLFPAYTCYKQYYETTKKYVDNVMLIVDLDSGKRVNMLLTDLGKKDYEERKHIESVVGFIPVTLEK
jgi:hypothetical protein